MQGVGGRWWVAQGGDGAGRRACWAWVGSSFGGNVCTKTYPPFQILAYLHHDFIGTGGLAAFYPGSMGAGNGDVLTLKESVLLESAQAGNLEAGSAVAEEISQPRIPFSTSHRPEAHQNPSPLQDNATLDPTGSHLKQSPLTFLSHAELHIVL